MKNNDFLCEIRLAGFGGQGLITAGMSLAQAIAYEGKYHVCNTQSYGPESRGGACKAELIISNSRIFHPKPESVDIFVALSQAAFDKHADELKPGAITFIEADLVHAPVGSDLVVAVPFTQLSEESTGLKISANVVAVGVLYDMIKDLVSRDSLLESVLSKVPPGTEEKNTEAFEAGIQAAKEKGLDRWNLFNE